MFDAIIRGAQVLDGSGSGFFAADIAIKDGRIAAIGEVDAQAARVFDARGLVVAPGFIDMHSHSDMALFIDPRSESKLTQGITTEICGNCGFSAAPCLDAAGRSELESWRRAHDVEANWRSLAEVLSALDEREIGVNYATLVGHSNLRAAVVGLNDREASPAEIDRMKALAAGAMTEGAYGLSTGLIYPPSCYAGTSELIALAAAIEPYGGVYVTHIRDEHDGIVEAVEEAIRVGRESGAGVHISHHKACGRTNWGRIRATLSLIQESRRAGMDLTVDQYPYTAGCTSLGVVIPAWAHDGGPEALIGRVRDQRRALLAHLQDIAEPDGWLANDGGWKSVIVSGVRTDRNRNCEGKSIQQLADERGREPGEVVLDLLAQERLSVSVITFAQCEDDIEAVMRSDIAMFGTDSSARGTLDKGKPHPRAFGTYPRVLGRYVRERNVVGLAEAVRKMTSAPARKLGITDRGLVKEGFWADIVVFDPASVADTATYEHPHGISKGIRYVFVNGVLACEDGQLTNALAGRVLRHRAWQRRR